MCGKCTCDECSKSMRRLSKKDKNFYRVCDYCDNKVCNKQTEELFKRIIEERDNAIQTFKQKTVEYTEKIGERKKRMEKLEQKFSESVANQKKMEETLKVKEINLEKMVKALKESKRSLENTLYNNKSIVRELEAQIKESEDKHNKNIEEKEIIKTQIVNGMKRLQEYEDELEMKKLEFEGKK